MIIEFINYTINGALLGLLYARVAMGFVVIYRASKVFNMAIGEMIVLGAFLLWWALESRGINYAPDFVANAGGVSNVYSELAGWTRERALHKADEIFDTTLGVYKIAKEQSIPTFEAADKLAEARIASVKGMVRTWPQWPRKG